MLYKLRGADGQLELYEHKLLIRRRGIARFRRGVILDDKDIPLKDIVDIRLKKPGLLPGRIQFFLSDSSKMRKRGTFRSLLAETTVLFYSDLTYESALVLKQLIERLIRQHADRASVSDPPATSPLFLFQSLLDAVSPSESDDQTIETHLFANRPSPEDTATEPPPPTPSIED